MTTSRRHFIGNLIKTSGLLAAVLSLPRTVWASWTTSAFSAEDIDTAIAETYPGLSITDSDAITLKAPSIAENGAVVPITVNTTLPASSVSVFVEKNPSPLACKFNIQPRMSSDISARIRMGQTSNLIVLVESGGQLYRTTQEVKVTIGGCGG